MLRAVLDTNFWLATHVVVVTLGYASTFVAGLLAVIYIFLVVYADLLKTETAKRGGDQPRRGTCWRSARGNQTAVKSSSEWAKQRWARHWPKWLRHRVFATLFSFTGTCSAAFGRSVLGPVLGLDVKEKRRIADRALERHILHARWGGLVKERGLMNMACSATLSRVGPGLV